MPVRAWRSATAFGPVAVLGVLLGALLGAFCRPSDSPLALDGALVLAGWVQFPPHSVMAVNYLNSWTALHQLLALPLLLGASQGAAALLHDVALGICAFSGLLAVSQAVLRNLVPAVAVAILMFLCGTQPQLDDYEITFLTGDFSAWSAAVAFLAFGMLGCGRYRAAGVVALLAPAVHPVVGMWTAGVVCAAVATLQRQHPEKVSQFVRGALVGGLITAASLAAYALTRVPDLQGYDADLLRIYLQLWDFHRSVPYRASVTWWGIATVVLAAAMLFAGGGAMEPGETAMLRALLICTVGSIGAYELVHHVPGMLPEFFVRSMPGRLPGLHLTILPVLIAATILRTVERSVRHHAARWVASGILGLVCVAYALHALEGQMSDRWRIAAEKSASPALWLAIKHRLGWKWARWSGYSTAPWFPLASPALRLQPDEAPLLGRGVVAASAALAPEVHTHLHLPLLLDASAIDFIPYVPGTIKPVAAIIEEVYGVDFSSPPADARQSGALSENTGQDHWRTLSEQDWIRLAHKFCIGGVMAPADWTIYLPVARDLGRARYYRVPTELPSACATPARR